MFDRFRYGEKSCFYTQGILYQSEPFTSVVRLQNYSINKEVGPSSATATSNSKSNSLIKADMEMLERRGYMLPKLSSKIWTYDIIQKHKQKLDSSKFSYSLTKEFYSDSTGTAAGVTSKYLVEKATTELFEKNALFLIWYGGMGYKMKISIKNWTTIFNKYLEKNYKIEFYGLSYFGINNIVTIVKDPYGIIISTGVAGDKEIYKAVKHSIDEAYLQLWNFFGKSSQEKKEIRIDNSYSSNWLEKKIKKSIIGKDIENIKSGSGLPSWLKNLYVAYIPQKDTKHKVIATYSPQLYASLPLKGVIRLDLPINKMTIDIKKEELNNFPECIIA